MSAWIRRLMYALRRRRHDAELVEEIEAHRALRQAHLEREGVPLPQANAASQRAMGNVLLAREDVRDVWLGGWGTWCDMSEIRVAARSFLRDPALLVLAVLALALGVAASTAMFSAVHAVVLKPLPFPDQERLFLAWKAELRGGDRVVELSYPEFLDWREQLQQLADVSVLPTTVYGYSYILSGRGEPAEIDSARVGSSFFAVLGIRPALGRDFAPADDRVGASPVVIVTHEFWEKWLGSDPAAVGSVITLSDVGFTVIGVLPRGSSYPAGAELFTLAGTNQRWVSSRRAVFLQLIGRAKPGVSLARVRTHLNATIARLAEQYPETRSADQIAMLRTLPEQIGGSGRTIVWLLFGGSVMLLILAIVNVASLLATKAAARCGEIAVRLAIGADRRALLRQFLSEALLLSACGGVAGVAGAWVLIRSIAAIAPPTIARIDTVSLNGWALLFAVIALTGTTVALGVVPVMLAKRSAVGVLLRTNSTSVVSHRRVARLGQALVGIEVAMTLALLVIAATMARSALKLQNVPLGYDTENVFSAQVALSQTRYREVLARQQFYHDLLEELRRDPAVVAAGAVLLRPLEGQIGWDMHYVLPGQSEAEAARNPMVNFEVITPGYFAAIGTPLIAGRQFADHEDVSKPQVTIVSEAVARRMYGSPEAALGKQFRFGTAMTGPMVTIVGVVADARYRHLTRDEGDAFVPYRQSALPTRYLVVRTRGHAEGAARLVRRAVAAVDPAQSISREATSAAIVSRASVRERFNSLMLLLFAAISVALTAAGVYGVVTTVVARRCRELGLRRALGAKGADVVRLVLRSTLSTVAVGEIVGLLGGVLATLAFREMLFDVSPVDPLAIVGGTVTVLVIASAACMPAVIRAVATEPMRILRRGDAA